MTIESQESTSPVGKQQDDTSADTSTAMIDENLDSSPEGEQPDTGETLNDAIAEALQSENDEGDEDDGLI